jgi:predicted O-methyltransferase YrrM
MRIFGELKTKVHALFPSSGLRKDAAENLSTSTSLSLDDMKKMQHEIARFLLLRGCSAYPLNIGIAIVGSSGSCSPEELLYLASAVQREGSRLIGEIGFNVGFSSYAFLSADSEARVVSFDISKRASLRAAKKLIDNRFPSRHTLIFGDSRKTVPEFKSKNPALHFDLVFIDGSHEYVAVKADIVNMKALCTDKTVVVLDDFVPWSVGLGPTRAWTEAIQEGIIRQDELFNDGKSVDVIEPPANRAWAVGRYVF